MRVMLDTIIYVSIYVFKSELLKNILVNILKNHTLIISTYIIEELYNVVKERFPKRCKSLNVFLNSIKFEFYFIPKSLYKINTFKLRDKKDIPILYSAIISKTDILITGDNDFKGVKVKDLEIMTPREYYEKYLQN